MSLLVSPRTKNTPEDWKRTRFCARTHTKKKQGHAYSLLLCCVIGTRRSIDFARSIVTFWLARGGFVGPIRERPTSRSLFFRSEFDARCTAIFPSALRSIQNALEAKKTPNKLSTRARENTQNTHTQRRRRRRRQRRKETTTTHPCIARLPISPIRPIRRRTFPKTPPRPRLVSLWMPTPTTPTPRPSSRTRSFSSSHNNTCCFFCRRRP